MKRSFNRLTNQQATTALSHPPRWEGPCCFVGLIEAAVETEALGASGQGMSRKPRTTALWVTLWAASTLNFPRLSFEEDFLAGIAIVNPTDQEAVVTFTAYDQSGQLLTGSGITNPAAPETIPGNQQLAKLTSDLFGVGLDPATVAWFQATSPADDLTGFFLFLSIPLPATNFDGADLPPSDSTIVFTQLSLASGDSTELNIINPSSATADLQLELVRADTIPVTKSLSIPAMGAARLDAATFFGISEAGPDSFITVTSNVDIAGFELIRFLQGDMIGSNARSGAEQLTHLYFPQMVVLGIAETTLGVVNQGTQAVILTITAFQPDGSIYGTENLQSNPVTRALNPGESLVEDVETMFGFNGQEILDGWLQVESTSEAVTGFVSYGTPITGAKATVAPASNRTDPGDIFSHRHYRGVLYRGSGTQCRAAGYQCPHPGHYYLRNNSGQLQYGPAAGSKNQ